MPKKSPSSTVTADREHIFPASQLTPLAIKWQELSAAGRHKEAMLILDELIRGSTAMFERLAQYENLNSSVDLDILVSAAHEKMVRWLNAWRPKEGRLFTWLSKCAKNAFLSEVGKVTQMRRRCYTTGDNLERFYGVEDHEINRHDLAAEYRRKIREMHCRWGDPQELGALRYLIDCIVDDAHEKQNAIRSAAYCWGISMPMSKFFYNWAVVGLRHQFYEKAYVPFTEDDLVLAAESYDWWPDIVNIIGTKKGKELVVKMGGTRPRIPTLNAIVKLKEADQLRQEIDRSNLDPATIAEIARKRKKTVRSAVEIYREMLEVQHPNRSGEYSIYGDD